MGSGTECMLRKHANICIITLVLVLGIGVSQVESVCDMESCVECKRHASTKRVGES